MLIIVRAEFFKVKFLHVISRFTRADLVLSWTGEKFVDVVVQAQFDQRVPFVFVEPDAVAMTAAIKMEI